jgi:hypothetical protein
MKFKKAKSRKIKNIFLMFIFILIQLVTSSFEENKNEVDIISAFDALLIDQLNHNSTFDFDPNAFRANCELECPPGCRYLFLF